MNGLSLRPDSQLDPGSVFDMPEIGLRQAIRYEAAAIAPDEMSIRGYRDGGLVEAVETPRQRLQRIIGDAISVVGMKPAPLFGAEVDTVGSSKTEGLPPTPTTKAGLQRRAGMAPVMSLAESSLQDLNSRVSLRHANINALQLQKKRALEAGDTQAVEAIDERIRDERAAARAMIREAVNQQTKKVMSRGEPDPGSVRRLFPNDGILSDTDAKRLGHFATPDQVREAKEIVDRPINPSRLGLGDFPVVVTPEGYGRAPTEDEIPGYQDGGVVGQIRSFFNDVPKRFGPWTPGRGAGPAPIGPGDALTIPIEPEAQSLPSFGYKPHSYAYESPLALGLGTADVFTKDFGGPADELRQRQLEVAKGQAEEADRMAADSDWQRLISFGAAMMQGGAPSFDIKSGNFLGIAGEALDGFVEAVIRDKKAVRDQRSLAQQTELGALGDHYDRMSSLRNAGIAAGVQEGESRNRYSADVAGLKNDAARFGANAGLAVWQQGQANARADRAHQLAVAELASKTAPDGINQKQMIDIIKDSSAHALNMVKELTDQGSGGLAAMTPVSQEQKAALYQKALIQTLAGNFLALRPDLGEEGAIAAAERVAMQSAATVAPSGSNASIGPGVSIIAPPAK